jgi:creatinine amidohydrolase
MSCGFHVGEMSSTEFAQWVEKDPVVVLPIGSVEEHSNHLPLNTDCIQPMHVLEEVAKRHGNLLIMPLIPYGNCVTTANYPGTISIGMDTLYNLVLEILLELSRHGVRRMVVLSGHAARNHMAALRGAAQDVVDQNPEVRMMVLSDWDFFFEEPSPMPEGDGHAGTTETARVWAIRPDLVDKENLPGPTDLQALPKYMVLPDPEKYYPSGVMGGDPSKASEQFGREMNGMVAKKILALLNENFKEEG